MTIETYFWIAVGIIGLIATFYITKTHYQDKFEQDMSNSQKKYDREISQLEDKLKKLSATYESLKFEYERLLTRFNHDQEHHSKTLTQKYAAERNIADLQKGLYCARKHAKKMTTDFVSILSKLLGTHKN